MAGDGFFEIHLASQICFFYAADSYAVVIVDIGAGAVLDEWGLPLLVFLLPHILALLKLRYSLRHEKRFDILVYLIEYFEFDLLERCAGIAFYAAGTPACMKVADEVFFEQVLTDYFIVY